jgi:hypothetical protein
MSSLLKNVLRFAFFILFQVYVLHKIPSLHRFVNPYLYFLFILWLPITSMGWAPYATYVFILTLLHHGYMVFLEWMHVGSFLYFLGKVVATTGISLLLILIAELLTFRKERFRTNTA